MDQRIKHWLKIATEYKIMITCQMYIALLLLYRSIISEFQSQIQSLTRSSLKLHQKITAPVLRIFSLRNVSGPSECMWEVGVACTIML